jgi:hypothetical protein
LKVLQRLPDSNEVSMASEFIARQTKLLGNEEAARKELVRGLLNTNEFLYID